MCNCELCQDDCPHDNLMRHDHYLNMWNCPADECMDCGKILDVEEKL